VPFLFNGLLSLFQESKPEIKPFPFSSFTIPRTPILPTRLPHLDRTKKRAFVEISDPYDEHVWNVYYTILTRLIENNNVLSLGNGTIEYNASTNSYNDQIDSIDHVIDMLQELLNNAVESMHDLQKGILPLHIHDYDALLRMIDEYSQNQNTQMFDSKQLHTHLRTHKHTFVVRDNCTDKVPSDTCSMYVVTYIPIAYNHNCYTPYEVKVFPVIKPGVVKDDWISVNIPEKHILVNEHSVRIINPEEYWCYDEGRNDKRICIPKERHSRLVSPCFIINFTKQRIT
jgi:hypothetical protein